MNRNEAVRLLKEYVKTEYTIKHCLAVGAIMKGLAIELENDAEKWSLVGLLHDIDFEKTKEDHSNHTIIAEQILSDKINEDIIRAIKSHNFEHTNVNPEKDIENALIAADAVSGLIIAAALIQPSKKLADVTVESIAKKFKKKDFARNCSRDKILYYEKLGIDRIKFFEIALKSLQNISGELGL